MSEPLLSWKKKRPASPEELEAAELLERIGEPKALPPEALARIGTRLRERRKSRRSLIPDMRLALLAGGVAAVAIVGALSFQLVQRRTPEALQVSAPVPPPMIAAAPTPAPPPAASPSSPAEAPEALARLEVAREEAASDRAMAKPAMAKPAMAKKEMKAERVEHSAYLAERSVASGAAAAPLRSRAASAPAPAAAPAESNADDVGGGVVGGVIGTGLNPSTSAECRRQYPDSAIDGDDSDTAERTLFDRALCLRDAHQHEESRRELRAYLKRFPNGQFVERAKAMLKQ